MGVCECVCVCVCVQGPVYRSKTFHFPEISFLKNCEVWVESPQNSNSRKKRNILIASFVNHPALVIYYII